MDLLPLYQDTKNPLQKSYAMHSTPLAVMDKSVNETRSSWSFHSINSDVFALASIYILLMVTGIIANALIALAISGAKLLKKRPQFILMNLIVCNILISIIAGPYYTYSASCRCIPPRSEVAVSLCRTFLYFSYSLGFISIFSLMLVSVDRYTAVVKPYFYQRHVTSERVFIVSLASWLTPFLFVMPAPLTSGWLDFEGVPFGLCGVQWRRMSKAYTSTLIVTCFFIPTSVIFFTNIRVFLIAHKQKKQILCSHGMPKASNIVTRKCSILNDEMTSPAGTSKRLSATGYTGRRSRMASFNSKKFPERKTMSVTSRDVQIAVSTLLLVTCYMLSWLPFVLLRIFEAFRLGQVRERVAYYSSVFPFSIVAWDPLLILWCRSEIRKSVKLLFCRQNRVEEGLPRRKRTSLAYSATNGGWDGKTEQGKPELFVIPGNSNT